MSGGTTLGEAFAEAFAAKDVSEIDSTGVTKTVLSYVSSTHT
jgi:hypothetical protein